MITITRTMKTIIVTGTIRSFRDLAYTLRAEVDTLNLTQNKFLTVSGNLYILITQSEDMQGWGRDCYHMALHDDNRDANRLAIERFKHL